MSNKKDENNKPKKATFVAKEPRPLFHPDHRMPRTRREFLAQGFIAISSTVVLPSFASLVAMSDKAYADSPALCMAPTFIGSKIPYICLDVGGGMNIAGANAIVGLANGGDYQEDVTVQGSNTSDYIKLGITPEEHPSRSGKMDGRYGLKFHRASGILQGMKEVLDGVNMPNGKPIEDGIDGLIFCTRTSDDTQNNQINTVYMANKVGAKGELVQLIGNSNTDSGGRSLAPSSQINLAYKPTGIRRHEDTKSLLSVGDSLMGSSYLRATEEGGQERVKKFMDRISKMNKARINEAFNNDDSMRSPASSSLEQIKQALNCSTESAKQLIERFSLDRLNSAVDAEVIEVFNGEDERVASVAKLVIDGLAGAGTITIGGGDYHGGAMASTHAKDVEVGRTIGLCIKLAAAKGKNLMVHLFTDGGVSADAGGVTQPADVLGIGQVPKVLWVGDSGTRSSALLIAYKHNHDGSSLVREGADGPRRQVGNFIKNGGVNMSSVVGNSTENLWKAIMLNYLAAQGREGEFEDIFGRASLPPEYESLIRFKQFA